MPALCEAYTAQGDEIAVSVLSNVGRLRVFITEVQGEMKRVTWPDLEQLRNATAVIIVFVLIVAGIIGLMDVVFRRVVEFIIAIFGG